MTALNLPPSSAAFGINAQGDIVGWFHCSDRANCAVIYHPDGSFDSLDLGVGAGVNDAGDVVGWSSDAAERPLSWDAEGETGAPGQVHAVLWTPYGLANLGTLGGTSAQALAINGDLIVGWSGTPSGDTSAFLYDNNGPGYPVDLNELIAPDSGWKLIKAAGINAAGQIVGSGDVGGQHHAFVLTPATR